MNDTVSKPFFAQLKHAFTALFCSVVAALCFIFLLFIWRDIQLHQIKNIDIPRLKKHYQSQQLIAQALTTINQFEQSSSANQFNRQYQDLQQQYQALTVFFKSQSLGQGLSQSTLIASLIEIQNEINYTTESMSDNSAINQSLLNESVYLFKGLIPLLAPEIMANNQQQASLLQQVLQDNITDRVTVRRARAYGKVSKKLISLNNLSQDLTLLLVKLKRVNMQTDLEVFELLQIEVDDFLAQAKISFSEQTEQKEQAIAQLTLLEKLLNTPQGMLDRWHDQLRLYAQLKNALNQQKNILLTIKNNLSDVDIELAEQRSPSSYTGFVATLKKTNYQLKLQMIPLMLVVVALSFLAIVVFIIFRILTRIKQADEQTIMMCKQLIEADALLPKHFHSARDQHLAHFMRVNSQPLHREPIHREDDYQKLVTTHLHQLTTIAKNNDVVYWQAPTLSEAISIPLWRKCLAGKSLRMASKKEPSWRHYFEKTDVHHLLDLARGLKKFASAQDSAELGEVVLLTTKAGEVVALTLYYNNKQFFGTVANATLQDGLNKEIKKLNVDFENHQEESQEKVRHKNVAYTHKLEKMLLRALLQSQSVSIGFDGASFHVYRQLSRILDWCQQQLLSEELRLSKHSLQIVDISLKGVLHSAILNAMCEARAQRNSITLKCDPQLMTRVKLDINMS